MRIVSGRFRGRRLNSPGHLQLRPTPEKVREALFHQIQSRIAGAHFLDAYAGTGAIGLEALSRGAASVTFIEKNRRFAALIQKNVRSLDLEDETRLLVEDFLAACPSEHPFDILFFDPPYHEDYYTRILSHLTHATILRPESLIILEHFKKNQLPERTSRLKKVRSRFYGDSVLTFYSGLDHENAILSPDFSQDTF